MRKHVLSSFVLTLANPKPWSPCNMSKRMMLKPLLHLVSSKEPAAEPAAEEASQATQGWKDSGVMLWVWLQYLKMMRYLKQLNIGRSRSKKEGCEITNKNGADSRQVAQPPRSRCVDGRFECEYVVSGRATNSGEQCCWLSKGQSRFEGLPFKPRSAFDGSEVGGVFITHTIYKYSTYMSQGVPSSGPLSLDACGC